MEVIHDMSKLKFSGEGEPSFCVHVHQVISFFLNHKIEYKDVWTVLLTLTFKVHVNKWCHILPLDD